MAAPVTSLEFRVRRGKPELLPPARPTPRELKNLSDLDDQDGLRFHVSGLYFYQCDDSMQGKDPARVIRDALAQALVFYYPMAGRLREGPDRKLMVDCTGEGILFAEADADVELKQFGDPPEPPFPCLEKLLHDIPEPEDVLSSPLLLVQVTRLRCGNFILAFCFNHNISDGFGANQFWNAVCQMARGASIPSICPVWKRDVFKARNPPRVTCKHREYDEDTGALFPNMQYDNFVERSFFFGSSEMFTIRKSLSNSLTSKYTDYEVLTGFLWRSRTKALMLDPEVEVRLSFCISARGTKKFLVPNGYYGNAIVFPAVVTTAKALCNNSLEYALDLVRKMKEMVTKEYIQSTIDLLVTKDRPFYAIDQLFFVSDVTHVGLDEMDFGWGKPVLFGVATTDKGLCNYYMRHKTKKGEVGRLVLIGLPSHAMKGFVMELENMLGHPASVTC